MNDQSKNIQLEEKLAEAQRRIAELEAAEQELHLIREVLANASGQMVWAMTPDYSRALLTLPFPETISGYPEKEFSENPQKWFEIIHPDDHQLIQESLARLQVEGHREIESRIIRPDGSIRWLLDKAVTIRDKQGEVKALAGITSDITERKEAEKFAQLQRELAVASSGSTNLEEALEKCIHLVMKTSGADFAAVYQTRADNSLDLVSHKGIPEELLPEISYFPSNSPHAAIVQACQTLYMDTEKAEPSIRKDAKRLGHKSAGIIPILHHGRPVAVLIVAFKNIVDIPETVRYRLEAVASTLGGMIVRLEAEKKHRESEASMRAMLDAISESAFLIDKNQVVLIANETAAKRYGMTVEQLVGTSLKDLASADIISRRQINIEEVIRTKQSVHAVDARNNFIFDYWIYPVFDDSGEVTLLAVFAKDITDQHEANEFANLHQELAVASSATPNLDEALETCINLVRKTSSADWTAIYLANEDNSLNLVSGKGMSEEFWKDVSYFPSDSLQVAIVQAGQNLYLNIEDAEPSIPEHVKDKGLKSYGIIPIQYLGQFVAVLVVGFADIPDIPKPVRYRLEAIASRLGSMIVRFEAEKKHRESESTMRAMLDAITESAFLVSYDDHIVLAANETTAIRLGTTVEGLIGHSAFEFLSPEIAKSRKAFIDNVARTGKPGCIIDQRSGMIIESHIYPVFDELGEVSSLAVFAKDVTEQQQAAEKIAVEQKLLRELFELQERERTLVSHEIHDGVVQDIVVAKMFMNVLSAHLKSACCEFPEETAKIGERLNHAIAEARRLIRELRPLIIEEQGVIRSIDHLVMQERDFTDIRIEFEHDVTSARFDPMLEGNIYRIVQEAVRNARRHSSAKKIQITLTQNDGQITINIVDDGIGFNPDTVSEDRFGVRGIRERARLFGGNTRIESSPGKGTRIFVQLPIEPKTNILGPERPENSQ